MHRSNVFVATFLFALVVPISAEAATLLDTVQLLSVVLNAAVGLFITLAIVVFFWGLIKYLASASHEHKSEALKTMFYGVITIFVMVSIWGIVRLLQQTFKVTSTEPVIPQDIKINLGRQQTY